MRRFSLRDYLSRHPAVLLAIVTLAMADLTALSVKRLDHARATVHGNWTLTVIIGVAMSLAVIGSVTGCFWSVYRRRVRNPRAGPTLFLGLTGMFVLGLAVTRSAVAPQIGVPEPVTTTFQLGAIAFMIPFYCGLLALFTLIYLQQRKKRRNAAGHRAATGGSLRGDVLTAFIDRADGGWSVTWFRDGKTPRKLNAPTLTASAERATAAAVELFANQPATATTELQLAICPGPYQRGPIWQVSGSPGALIADQGKGRTICVRTLEDLLTAIQATLDGNSSDFILRWTRPITGLRP